MHRGSNYRSCAFFFFSHFLFHLCKMDSPCTFGFVNCQSLERCQLKDVVASKPDKLDSLGKKVVVDEDFDVKILFFPFSS